MAEKYIGYIISVNCGTVLGVYEGQVIAVDSKLQTVTMSNVSRNEERCNQVPTVTLSARDIISLRIVEKVATKSNQSSAVRNDTLQLSPFSAFETISNSNAATRTRGSPLKMDENKKKGDCHKKALTPKKTDSRRKTSDRNDACFSEPVNSYILENDFDFEKNLALFDKRAVFKELNASSKPDIVKLVDCNRRTQQNYRYDEHILDPEPIAYNQIEVPCVVEKQYITDSGLIVPSITRDLRRQILLSAERCGLSIERQLEMTGRAGAEMILQLLGGGHRLNPQNSHQKPTVVALCGNHMQGAQGANCARHLSNHGVNVTVLSPSDVYSDKNFANEQGLLNLTEGKQTTKIGDLPASVDIILSALDSLDEQHTAESMWHKAVVQWANNCRAPILGLDPPPEGNNLNAKWILVPLLPFALSDNSVAIYICDISVPKAVFKSVGITYVSPFGSKFIIPVYER